MKATNNTKEIQTKLTPNTLEMQKNQKCTKRNIRTQITYNETIDTKTASTAANCTKIYEDQVTVPMTSSELRAVNSGSDGSLIPPN